MWCTCVSYVRCFLFSSKIPKNRKNDYGYGIVLITTTSVISEHAQSATVTIKTKPVRIICINYICQAFLIVFQI